MHHENISLHRYTDGVLLEVICDEGNGDVTAITVEFDLKDESDQVLSPRGDLPEGHKESIRSHLETSDYILAERHAR